VSKPDEQIRSEISAIIRQVPLPPDITPNALAAAIACSSEDCVTRTITSSTLPASPPSFTQYSSSSAAAYLQPPPPAPYQHVAATWAEQCDHMPTLLVPH
jgi:hypothetical protein